MALNGFFFPLHLAFSEMQKRLQSHQYVFFFNFHFCFVFLHGHSLLVVLSDLIVVELMVMHKSWDTAVQLEISIFMTTRSAIYARGA